MQIGQHPLHGYELNMQNNTPRTESGTEVRTNGAVPGSEAMGLKEGMVFRGEILDIAGDKVTIALQNAQTMTARLQQGVQLGVGDRLLFSVKENNASQILIRPISDSVTTAQMQTLEKALDAAGLSPTEKNLNVARELMDAGMPVDKKTMVHILSQSLQFEGTSTETLISMNRNHLPVTPETVAQFERYENLSHQLTGDVAIAADTMAEFPSAFPTSVSGQTLLDTASQLTDLFSFDVQADSESVTQPDIPAETSETVQPDAARLSENPGTIREEPKGVSVPVSDQVSNPGGTETVFSASPTAAEMESASQKWNADSEAISNFVKQLHTVGISDTDLSELLKRSGSDADFLRNTMQMLSSTDLSDQAVRSLLSDEPFRKLFSDFLKKGMSLAPEKMQNPSEIDRLYETILKKTHAFEETVMAQGGSTKGFQQGFQNMRDNLHFMEQLNQQMIYAQMPVRMSDGQVNSELYIYADKRKLLQKKDDISVMLHLDMEALGATDVHVTLSGNHVHARFYFNDAESVDVVQEHMEQLEGQLEERGFSLTHEVTQRTSGTSVNRVIDEVLDENAERSVKRYTFDART